MSSLKRLLFGSEPSSTPSPTTPTQSSPQTATTPSAEFPTQTEVLQPTSTSAVPSLESAPALNEANISTPATPVHKMAASSGESSSGSGQPYDKNISHAGAQAKLHATQSVSPEGTGASLPQELRAGLASTPSSSVLNQAATDNQFNTSNHFSSAGAQARAAAAGVRVFPIAAPAGTHSAHAGPAAVSGQTSPNISAMTSTGIGAAGSTSNSTGTTGDAASQFPSNSPYQPIEASTPQNAGFIHAFNTINELDDRSAPGSHQQPMPLQNPPPQGQQQSQFQPQAQPPMTSPPNFEPPVQRSADNIIHALNTAQELDQAPPSTNTASTNPAFSSAGYDARAAAAGTAPSGTFQPQNTPHSVRTSYEAEAKYQYPSHQSEMAKNFSPAGYAAKQFATHTISPEGTAPMASNGARSPFTGSAPSQGTISSTPSAPGSDPNVSQAGVAARQGATQSNAPEGTGHWGKRSYSTVSAGRAAMGNSAMRIATRRSGPIATRVGAIGIAGLLHFIA